MGGSGTRVVAQILASAGIFWDNQLNEAFDSLLFQKVFSLLAPRIRDLGPIGSSRDPEAEAQTARYIRAQIGEFARGMHAAYLAEHSKLDAWGWKFPGNHFLLPCLAELFPEMQYVHVLRHGLDMAFSENQHQTRNWGRHLGIDINSYTPEKASLLFWIAANRRAVTEARKLGISFFLLNFDQLCRDPRKMITSLMEFLRKPTADIEDYVKLVIPPKSLGRRHGQNLDFCGPEEWIALKEFGFEH